MKRLPIILLIMISCAVQAEIYKSQNEKGEWVYSDTPSPSAERMKLPPLSTYTPTTPAQRPASVPKESKAEYESMVFAEPENNATIRNNEGLVDASVSLEPLLKSHQGHKIQFYLDGKPYGAPVVGSKLTLENLDRGTHVLGAQVLDAGGEVVFRASPVTVHVHRQSALMPKFKPGNGNLPKPNPKPKPVS
jgi:cell division septation protein DedD